MINLSEAELLEINRLTSALTATGRQLAGSLFLVSFPAASGLKDLDHEQRRQWLNRLRSILRGEPIPVAMQSQLPFQETL